METAFAFLHPRRFDAVNEFHDLSLQPQELAAGLAKLPDVLKIEAAELDTTTVLTRHPLTALFVAGAGDKVAPADEVEELCRLAPGSDVIVVPNATHEAVTYFFQNLEHPIMEWLDKDGGPGR